MPKFFIKTYGCQMNERDSEQVAHSLIARGYERVAHESEADVVLLNTCKVRDMADQKAMGKMGMLGRLAKERPQVVFGFLGCMAQARGESLLKALPHVDLVVGTQKFHGWLITLRNWLREKTANPQKTLNAQRPTSNVQWKGGWTICAFDCGRCRGARSQSTIREQDLAPRQATAFVSIMQGCNMHCILHRAADARHGAQPFHRRNRARVRDLVSRGVKEVTLLGQIVNLGGRHEFPKIDNKSPFVQLLEGVHDVDGSERPLTPLMRTSDRLPR
jgi:tRNA-2-methylthio-N6-dimethylallyladenosine synthase